MQLPEAIQLVQKKFASESQDVFDGPDIDAYHDAFEKYPVIMEVATYFLADQIVQQQYELRRQAAAQQAAAGTEGGEAPPQGTA